MTAQAISQMVKNSIMKTIGKVMLPPVSISIVGIKTPTLQNTNILYELNFNTFQLLDGGNSTQCAMTIKPHHV